MAERMMPGGAGAPYRAPVVDPTRRHPDGVRGILAGVGGLGGWLDVAVLALTVAAGVRYLSAHGLADRAPVVLAGAALLLAV